MDSSQENTWPLVLMSSTRFRRLNGGSIVLVFSIPYLTNLFDLPLTPTLTTTVFSQCRSGWFEAGPCRQASEGHKSSITSVASHASLTAPAVRSALLRHTSINALFPKMGEYPQVIKQPATCASTRCWPKLRPFSHEDFVFMLPGKT